MGGMDKAIFRSQITQPDTWTDIEGWLKTVREGREGEKGTIDREGWKQNGGGGRVKTKGGGGGETRGLFCKG